jgi:hypothetical protein
MKTRQIISHSSIRRWPLCQIVLSTIENTFSKLLRYERRDYALELIDTAGQVSFSSWHLEFLLLTWLLEYFLLKSKHFIGIHGYMLVHNVAIASRIPVVGVRELLVI